MVGRSFLSMVVPSFSGVLIVLSGDVFNPIFCITLIVFVNVYQGIHVMDWNSSPPPELNIISSMVISGYLYQPLTKAIFLVLKSVEMSLTYFWVGFKPPKLLYKLNLDKLICLVLIETVFCGRLCLVLGPWFYLRQVLCNMA